jgi:hypothetical protein
MSFWALATQEVQKPSKFRTLQHAAGPSGVDGPDLALDIAAQFGRTLHALSSSMRPPGGIL